MAISQNLRRVIDYAGGAITGVRTEKALGLLEKAWDMIQDDDIEGAEDFLKYKIELVMSDEDRAKLMKVVRALSEERTAQENELYHQNLRRSSRVDIQEIVDAKKSEAAILEDQAQGILEAWKESGFDGLVNMGVLTSREAQEWESALDLADEGEEGPDVDLFFDELRSRIQDLRDRAEDLYDEADLIMSLWTLKDFESLRRMGITAKRNRNI